MTEDKRRRPSDTKRTHMAVPLGNRLVEIRSDGQPLTASEWKDLARYCFVSAAAIGEPYRIQIGDCQVVCQSLDDVIQLIEHFARHIPNATELLIRSTKLPPSELAQVERKLAESRQMAPIVARVG